MFFSLIQTFINIDVGVLKRLCVLRLIYRSLWLEFLMFPSMDKQTGTDAGNTPRTVCELVYTENFSRHKSTAEHSQRLYHYHTD